jgi:hypothetical protein
VQSISVTQPSAAPVGSSEGSSPNFLQALSLTRRPAWMTRSPRKVVGQERFSMLRDAEKINDANGWRIETQRTITA